MEEQRLYQGWAVLILHTSSTWLLHTGAMEGGWVAMQGGRGCYGGGWVTMEIFLLV